MKNRNMQSYADFFRSFRSSSETEERRQIPIVALRNILIFTLVLITVAFLAIYFIVRSHTLSRIYDSEEQIVSNINHCATIMQDEAASTLMGLYDNPQMMQLVYSMNTERMETTRAMLQLKSSISNSSWIDSAYIYNTTDNMFLYSYQTGSGTMLSFCQTEDFYDTAVLDIFASDAYPQFPILRTVTRHDGTQKTVFTYGLQVINTRDTYDGLFIINVSADQLLAVSRGFTGMQDRQILIASSKENYYSSNSQFLSESERDMLLDQAFLSENSSGQYISSRDDMICTWIKDNKSQMCFISCVPYRQVSSTLNVLLRWYLAFFVIVIAFSAFDVLLLSRGMRNYESLQAKYDRISKQYQDNYGIIKNTVLRNFFNLGSRNFVVGTQFQDNDIHLEDFSHYAVSLLSAKQIISPEGTPSISYPTMHSLLYDTFQNRISTDVKFELVDMLQGRYLLITEHTDADALTKMLQQTAAYFTSQNILELSCISLLDVSDLLGLPDAYMKLIDKQELLFFYPHGSCILYSELENRPVIGYEYASGLCSQLLLLLDKQAFSDAEAMLNQFFDQWFEPVEDAQRTMRLLADQMDTFIQTFQHTHTLTLDFDKDNFVHLLLRCNSSLRAKLLFSNLLADIRAAFDSVGSRSSYVDKMIDLMNREFADSNLNVSLIADALGLSLPYTQNLFKSATGISVSTYLRQLRMDKAKELLLTTDYPVAEIAKQVGLDNANYFYTSFKKQFNLTPGEYRARYRSQS